MRKIKRSKRANHLKIRMSDGEMQHAREVAKAAGIPMASLVRQSIGRCRTWTVADRQGIRNLASEIAKCGNNINQIARHLNQSSNPEALDLLVSLQKIEAELSEIREYYAR